MSGRPSPARTARYTAVAMALHWVIGLGILAQLALGLMMTQLAQPLAVKFGQYQLHKSIGITMLLAVVLRLLWRLTHRPPPLPADMPVAERRIAHGAHWLLYLLMFGLPLTGWAMVSASVFNLPTVLFGVVTWPHLPVLSTLTDKKPVEDAFKTLHALAGFGLMALLVAHIGAALRHAGRGDGVMGRMLPARSEPQT